MSFIEIVFVFAVFLSASGITLGAMAMIDIWLGPKFWPKVSPKKTWSGTVAGWVGAAAVGYGFHAAGQGPVALVWVSPLIAFAGQLGDIAESAIKRRAGVKDSSSLIPGHGGLLDRFDALAFAAVLTAVLHIFVPLFAMVKG